MWTVTIFHIFLLSVISVQIQGFVLTVYNGTEADKAMFPSIGLIQIIINATHYVTCGANLINIEWAVTAAHCFYDETTRNLLNYLSKSVIFGDIYSYATEPFQERQTSSFNYTIHERYIANSRSYDIALLHLDKTLRITKYVSAVNMSTSYHETKTHYGCQVAGWGLKGNSSSSKLLYANLSLTNSGECRKKYGWMKFRESTMLCAGSTTSDSCKGDSGGPLYCINKESSRVEIVGLVSFGDTKICKPSTTGSYTRVSAYKSWIDSIVEKDSSDWITRVVIIAAGCLFLVFFTFVLLKCIKKLQHVYHRIVLYACAAVHQSPTSGGATD